MRNYYIYLLKEDVAYDYFWKERLIYDLFVEKLQANEPEYSQLLEKQINYITSSISVIDISRFIDKNLKVDTNYNEETLQFIYTVHSKTLHSSAKLEINSRYIKLTAEGSYDAEATFFEAIRKYNSCFFAMDFENYDFGWLKPIKQKRYV